MPGIKKSRQRDSILAYLDHNESHPTADMVYTAVRKSNPNISLGTVYRNLAQLESLGKVKKISFHGQPDRFDFRTAPHYHFMCTRCGCIMDLDLNAEEKINEVAQADFQGQIEGHTCYFYGLCPACLDPENK